MKGVRSTERIVYHTDDELLMMVYFTRLLLQHSRRSPKPRSGVTRGLRDLRTRVRVSTLNATLQTHVKVLYPCSKFDSRGS